MKRIRKQQKVRGEMRSEYDFHGGARGKYAAQYAAGTNLVTLAPDVAARFSDSNAVNEALRLCSRLVDTLQSEAVGRRKSRGRDRQPNQPARNRSGAKSLRKKTA